MTVWFNFKLNKETGQFKKKMIANSLFRKHSLTMSAFQALFIVKHVNRLCPSLDYPNNNVFYLSSYVVEVMSIWGA